MGIAFVVLFVAGFVVFPTPSDEKDTAKWAHWWSDSGHRAGAVIGAYLMVLGVLAFVWFMWDLNQRLRRRSGVMITFGSLFVGVALISALIRASIPGAKVFGDTPLPSGADFPRQIDNIGFALLLVAGALAAGAFTATAAYAARRDGLLPRWLTSSGYVVAVLQLAAGLFFRSCCSRCGSWSSRSCCSAAQLRSTQSPPPHQARKYTGNNLWSRGAKRPGP
jgi:hypothetical protein